MTYKVIAYSAVPGSSADYFVDWAYEMLLLGHDTPNLAILAGINKPTSKEEALPYLKTALAELDLSEKTGDDAVVCYTGYLINKMLATGDIKGGLEALNNLYCCNNSLLIHDFYLLAWAWTCFESTSPDWIGETYWPGATNDTIGQVVLDVAKKWLNEHESQWLVQTGQ